MKKILTILAMAGFAISASAQTFSTNFFPEGTFSPTPTTNIGFAGPQDITFPTTGGNPGDYGRIDSSGGGGWGVIVVGESPIPLTDVGMVAGVEYEIRWDMATFADTNGVFSTNTGGIKIESWAGGANIGDTGDQPLTAISTNGTWDTYSYNYTPVAGATGIKLVPLVTGAAGNLGAIIGFDNFRVIVPDTVPLNAQITLPEEGAEVSTNGFAVTATAAVVPGSVTNVEFYADGVLQGNSTNAPYSLLITGLPPGPAALTVVAEDSLGGSVTSSVVNVTVVTNIVQTVYTLDPDAPWGGFMNVFELSENFGAFVFGSGWGVADLTAEFSGVGTNSILTLKPAPIDLAPCTDTNVPPNCSNGFTNDNFWYYYGLGFPENASGAVGFKSMEANLVITVDGENGNLIRFVGTNLTASLLDPSATNLNAFGENSWTCEAFIKDLDSDFQTNSGLASEIVVPITNGQAFDISLQTFPDPSRNIQYGIRTRGPNVWPGDEDIIGSVVFATVPAAPPVNVDVDPAANWSGFINVFETPQATNAGAFVFGQEFGFEALQATFGCPDGLVLETVLLDDTNEFWYIGGGGPGAVGNKIVESVAKVDDDSLSGENIIFSGTVVSTGLLDSSNTNSAGNGWTGKVIIRDFAPDYSSFTEASTPLVPGPFSIQLDTDPAPGRHIQYGFIWSGPTVWSTDSASFGNVVIETDAAVAPVLTATENGSNVDLSFCTQSGFSYQVEYIDDLFNGTWTALGSPVAGDGTTKTVSDAIGAGGRSYRLSAQ